ALGGAAALRPPRRARAARLHAPHGRRVGAARRVVLAGAPDPRHPPRARPGRESAGRHHRGRRARLLARERGASLTRARRPPPAAARSPRELGAPPMRSFESPAATSRGCATQARLAFADRIAPCYANFVSAIKVGLTPSAVVLALVCVGAAPARAQNVLVVVPGTLARVGTPNDHHGRAQHGGRSLMAPPKRRARRRLAPLSLALLALAPASALAADFTFRVPVTLTNVPSVTSIRIDCGVWTGVASAAGTIIGTAFTIVPVSDG